MFNVFNHILLISIELNDTFLDNISFGIPNVANGFPSSLTTLSEFLKLTFITSNHYL